jgi:hypothetical protein
VYCCSCLLRQRLCSYAHYIVVCKPKAARTRYEHLPFHLQTGASSPRQQQVVRTPGVLVLFGALFPRVLFPLFLTLAGRFAEPLSAGADAERQVQAHFERLLHGTLFPAGILREALLAFPLQDHCPASARPRTVRGHSHIPLKLRGAERESSRPTLQVSALCRAKRWSAPCATSASKLVYCVLLVGSLVLTCLASGCFLALCCSRLLLLDPACCASSSV